MTSKAFTLIELIVVVSIITLMTALILPNYREGERQLALQRSAYKLAQDLRRAQEMALSSQKFDKEVPAGYGIYLNKSQPFQYILFADLDNGKDYDAGETVEILQLERQIQISSLSPVSPLTIVFTPPDPQIYISGGNVATVVLRPKTDLTKTKSVIVNKAGLIAVQ